MEDSQHLCPDCGANYVEAVVDDIASGAGADSRLMLASLEEGLAGLDAVPLPALGDTARKMLPALCAAALVFCLLAGVATGANIFYLLAAGIINIGLDLWFVVGLGWGTAGAAGATALSQLLPAILVLR